MHWPDPEQQPLGQVAELQVAPVHWPFTHDCPPAQAPHTEPPEPHTFSFWMKGSTQVSMKQHPAQDIAPHGGPGTQAPCGEQLVPAGHCTHCWPPLPQAKLSCAARGMH